MKARRLVDPLAVVSGQMTEHWPTADRDAFTAIGSVLRAQRLLQNKMENDEAVRAHDLSFARLEILGLLYYNQDTPLPMTTISTWLMVHPGSVTNAVQRLVRQGYAEQIRPDSDRRMILASITQRGRRVVEECMPRLAAERFGFAALTPGEVSHLVDLLAKVRAESTGA